MRSFIQINFSSSFKLVCLLVFFGVFASCKSLYTKDYSKPNLVDKKPSIEARKLHKRLFLTAKKGIAIGHQDATSYGVGWRYGKSSDVKSDIESMVNDLPAVYGFDIGHLELGHENNLDSVPFDLMRELIIDAHSKGGIITISWHLNNPMSSGDSWDTTSAVASIIKGGKNNVKYELWVSRVAQFFKSLTYKDKQIPIIFRPFHEMNGSWFWWGESNCSSEDYITLWQQTVHLLRDTHGLHNILYTYSPNKLNPTDDYMRYYPGDDYVDIFGIDIYDFNNYEEYTNAIKHDLGLVKNIASEREKLFAFTETGLEKIPTPNWFSQILYPEIQNSGIAWILFWRNHIKTHHYVPYKGHSNEKDFQTFKTLPKTLFLKDINQY